MNHNLKFVQAGFLSLSQMPNMHVENCFHAMSCLSSRDRVLVSRLGRGSTVSVPHSSIHEAFENIADIHPTVTAATFAGRTITYLQLDISANRLAHSLISLGLRPGSRVCLVVQRSFEMLVGIFAILKAGCQYVPIDGGITSEQAFTHIFTDSNARFILCLPRFWDKIRRLTRRDDVLIPLSMDVDALFPSTKPSVQVLRQDGAYAIYTSGNLSAMSESQQSLTTIVGSTGKPKGVNVSHGNVTNALLLEPARLGITIGSKVAQVLNIAFDMGE
jgi:non-ribosomal peptide synthetase component F